VDGDTIHDTGGAGPCVRPGTDVEFRDTTTTGNAWNDPNARGGLG
jgi:hypothetical protein